MSDRRSLLRAAVNERLAAAAEEIFMLLERTIAEYEEEVCRSKEENQRNQQLLEVLLTRGSDSFSLDPRLKQETLQTIEEQEEEESPKQKEEQLPDFTAVCVKSEEQSSLIEQDIEEAQGQLCGRADISSQTHLHSETEEQRDDSYTDDDEDWGHPGSSSTAQMQTEGDLYNQVHTQELSGTGPRDLLSGTGYKDTRERKYECLICEKKFTNKPNLKRHLILHTGERPYSCSVCGKNFSQMEHRKTHMSCHTGERPYSCSICLQTFTRKASLSRHVVRFHSEDGVLLFSL